MSYSLVRPLTPSLWLVADAKLVSTRMQERWMHVSSDSTDSPVQGTIPFLGRGIEVGQYAEVCTSLQAKRK